MFKNLRQQFLLVLTASTLLLLAGLLALPSVAAPASTLTATVTPTSAPTNTPTTTPGNGCESCVDKVPAPKSEVKSVTMAPPTIDRVARGGSAAIEILNNMCLPGISGCPAGARACYWAPSYATNGMAAGLLREEANTPGKYKFSSATLEDGTILPDVYPNASGVGMENITLAGGKIVLPKLSFSDYDILAAGGPQYRPIADSLLNYMLWHEMQHYNQAVSFKDRVKDFWNNIGLKVTTLDRTKIYDGKMEATLALSDSIGKAHYVLVDNIYKDYGLLDKPFDDKENARKQLIPGTNNCSVPPEFMPGNYYGVDFYAGPLNASIPSDTFSLQGGQTCGAVSPWFKCLNSYMQGWPVSVTAASKLPELQFMKWSGQGCPCAGSTSPTCSYTAPSVQKVDQCVAEFGAGVLTTPVNLKGTYLDGQSSISWTWDKVANAAGYRLKDNKGNVIATVAQVGGNGPVAYVETIKGPDIYERTVEAYLGEASSVPSASVAVKVMIQPVNLRGSVVGKYIIWSWEVKADAVMVDYQNIRDPQGNVLSKPAEVVQGSGFYEYKWQELMAGPGKYTRYVETIFKNGNAGESTPVSVNIP